MSDANELIRFALAAQLASLEERGISQAVVARATGAAKSRVQDLSRIVSGSKEHATDEWLGKLDEAVVALAGDISNAGGLTSFAVRLRGVEDRPSLVAQTPPGWTRELLETPTNNDFGVLIRTSALLAAFGTARRAPNSTERVESVRNRHRTNIERLTKQLILIGACPPTSRNFDALIMLGNLGRHAFDLVNGQLEHALIESPLGFRVWRAYTKLVLLAERSPGSSAPVDSPVNRTLRSKVMELLTTRAKKLREVSLYPGRSLDLELAIAVPHEWASPDDWVGDVLLARARNQAATLRERCTAAHGLWQRAYLPGTSRDDVRQRIYELIDDFRTVESERRPDIASGLEWGAATLRRVVELDVATCNDWPDEGYPWLAQINAVAESLDRSAIPPRLLPGTKSLFRHALLQNAGVERRKAIDTLVAGGFDITTQIVSALGTVLDEVDEQDSWLRIRAIFAVGFLQTRSMLTVRILADAFSAAYDRVKASEELRTADLTELHTALFAIGDCLGVPRNGTNDEEIGQLIAQLRSKIEGRLRALAADSRLRTEPFHLVGRALAYMLTFTALPRKASQLDLSEELLRLLEKHPDDVTSKLSVQAVTARFASDGAIRTILDSPLW